MIGGRRSALRSTAVVAVAAAGAIVGCGGSGQATQPNGRVVFSQQCSSCHSLIGNESLNKPGGDLVGFRGSREVLLQYVSEMPTRRRLTGAEIQAVVKYLSAVERRGSPGP